MDDNFFGNYGVQSGYGQVAPGRDVERARQQGQPGRPRNQQVINSAIAPAPQQSPIKAVFEGARQTGVASGGYAAPRGGVTGGRVAVPPAQAPAPAAPAAPPQSSIPDFSKVGQYTGRMHGYSAEKLNNAEHNTPKYQIGRVLSNFDPAAGITPEVLSALNALNIGTFSGEGDKLTLGGNMHPDYAGVGGMDDIITRFTGDGADPQWGAYTNLIGQAHQRAQQAGAQPQGILGLPALQQAITGSGYRPSEPNFAERIRAQVMQALANQPGLASLSKF